MKRPILALVTALAVSMLPCSAFANTAAPKVRHVAPLVPPTGWTTYGHDNSRNAYDSLAPAFTGGPYSTWNKAVDQSVLAEPLAFGGRVYVATMGDSVYAFDATTGNQLWSRLALGTPSTSSFCSFNPGHVGIMGTPVIDPFTGILYVVGLTTSPSLKYQMYALNLSDGSNATGFPVDLGVDPTYQEERAALALANGHVYVAFGGWIGDCGNYHPLVVSVPTTGGAADHSWNGQTTCQNAAGIWAASGTAIDGSGNLFVATGNGNGCYGTPSYPCNNASWDRGNGVIKLSPTLAVTDSWAPDNATQSWCSLNASDTDIGSVGPALLPGGELFQTGKSGYGWLLSQTGLGGFDGQQFQAQIGSCSPDATFGGLAYYAGRIYVPCDGVGLVAFSVNTTTHAFNPTPDWVQPVNPGPPIAAMGLIWVRDQGGNNLYGFDPATGAQRVVSSLGGGANHFASLAEDAGWVFAAHGANVKAFNFALRPCTSTTSAHWTASCSYQQYLLSGSDGASWSDVDATNLTLAFTPAADSVAVISGNADLWTSLAGFNQDLGIAVSGGAYPSTTGQPEAWKESGGAATFSPNAALVQTVIPVTASVAYTARLQWKANRADPGIIWAGAGPIAGSFSPTRISVMLVPDAALTAFSVSSPAQYHLTASDGSTWQDIDTANLSLPFTPPTGSWLALVSGNADLWTASAGYNQDLGISMAGPGFPTIAGRPETWKESGGFAGTFSPNAAFAQAAVAVTGGNLYTAKLQWKSNRADPGTIYAGAGPIGAKFSPTSLSVVLVPNPAGAVVRSDVQQDRLTNSDGTTWQAVSNTALQLTLAPVVASNYLLAANADFWTSVAGYNQDLGIMVSGGTFGTGTLVGWKESGGTGAFSPNAAFVFADVPLVGGTTYTVWLAWKTNRPATGAIYAGAGPIGTSFSPTSLTATLLN